MIEVIQTDITTLTVDTIVNAANSSLLGGGGVDGAIHRAAGPELLAACRLLKGCQTGEAKITKGFNLAATHVIHTVGPVWQDGQHHEAELLGNCYKNSLRLALDNQLSSIAFPAISTGVYGFPKQQAATIALSVMEKYDNQFKRIIVVCFNADDKALYDKLMADMS